MLFLRRTRRAEWQPVIRSCRINSGFISSTAARSVNKKIPEKIDIREFLAIAAHRWAPRQHLPCWSWTLNGLKNWSRSAALLIRLSNVKIEVEWVRFGGLCYSYQETDARSDSMLFVPVYLVRVSWGESCCGESMRSGGLYYSYQGTDARSGCMLFVPVFSNLWSEVKTELEWMRSGS